MSEKNRASFEILGQDHKPLSSQATPRQSRKRSPRPDLLTAADAMAATGLPKATFQRLVREGFIPREVPFGKKEGYYPKAFIDVLASHLQGKVSYQEVAALLQMIREKNVPRRGAIDWVQQSDLPFIVALDIEMYGSELTVDVRTTSQWWAKNPHQCLILYDEEDRTRIWGAITIMPLPLERIHQLLKNEISEHEISPNDIQVYEEGKTYDGYIASAVIRPEHRSHMRSLIQFLLQFWCECYPSIRLRHLYANVTSDGGMDLVKHLFFSPLTYSALSGFSDNAFVLDPYQRNPSRLVQDFQRCIRAKQKQDVECKD